MKQKIKNWLVSVGMVGVMSIAVLISPSSSTAGLQYFKPLIPFNYAQTQDSQENSRLPLRDLSPLRKWLDRLAEEFECPGCASNYKRIDSNGKYSYGCLQFQEATFKAAIRRNKALVGVEDNELMNYIYDCEFQKDLAEIMWQSEGASAYYHWRTSIDRGLGMPPGYTHP